MGELRDQVAKFKCDSWAALNSQTGALSYSQKAALNSQMGALSYSQKALVVNIGSIAATLMRAGG